MCPFTQCFHSRGFPIVLCHNPLARATEARLLGAELRSIKYVSLRNLAGEPIPDGRKPVRLAGIKTTSHRCVTPEIDFDVDNKRSRMFCSQFRFHGLLVRAHGSSREFMNASVEHSGYTLRTVPWGQYLLLNLRQLPGHDLKRDLAIQLSKPTLRNAPWITPRFADIHS